MKKLTLIAVALLFVSTANAQWWGGKKIKGNGNMTKITRTTSDYDAIKCAGSFDYILVAGTEGNITIEGEENLLEYIITEVEGGKLKVKTRNNVSLRTSYNKTIKITIPFKDINEVSLSGSGDLWNEDKITSNNLKVALAGSGDVVINLEASSLKTSLSGSGDIILKGQTNDLDMSLAGSGDIQAFGLQANNTDVSLAGSGDIEVVSNKNLRARVAGSGDIQYKGNPDKEDTKVSGSGSISN